jgi:hypothetical protein
MAAPPGGFFCAAEETGMNKFEGMNDSLNAHVQAASGLLVPRWLDEGIIAVGRFQATLERDGEIIWEDEFHNLVLNAGKANLLDKYFAGSAYTAAWYMGLVDGGSTPTYNAADVSSSHAGWTENVGYSNSTRPSISWNAATGTGGGSGSAGAGSKASTATSFTINATGTIAGCFLSTLSTKSGTTGTTYSAGSFTAGNRSVLSGDTLSVTWTGTV